MGTKLDEKARRQTALQACYLLNEAIRQLLIPGRVVELTNQWMNLRSVPLSALAAVRHIVLTSIIINIFRLKETRDQFLSGWLFAEEDLRTFGFPPVEDFVGGAERWKFFEILRHQYAGHATGKEAKGKRPGTIVPAKVLGRAIRGAGLSNFDELLRRIAEELAPGVERVRNELDRPYPDARQFIEDYAVELEQASQGSEP